MIDKIKKIIEDQIGFPVYKFVKLNNIYVCMFDVFGRKNIDVEDIMRNIAAFDKQGNLIWRIRDIRDIENIPDRKRGGACYTGMSVDEEKNLWIFNFIGQRYRVDYKTGKILESQYTK